MARYRYPPISESEVTPRALFRQRRRLLQGGAALGAAALLPGGLLLPSSARAWQQGLGERLDGGLPSRGLAGDETPTPREDATSYNNFYELGTRKSDPEVYAHKLVTDPWSLTSVSPLFHR